MPSRIRVCGDIEAEIKEQITVQNMKMAGAECHILISYNL
jgi:hypothetical protein